MTREFLTTISLAILCASATFAQPSFTEVTPPDDPLFNTPASEDFWVNAVAPADIDGDGDLDLAVLGFYVVYNVSAVDQLVLFLNDGPDIDGNWTFTHVEVPLGTLTAGASDLAWGDFDTDGDPDLAVGSNGETVIFRNDVGVLSEIATSLPGYIEDSAYTGAYDLRSITWTDHDNDGDLDLLVPSVFDFDVFEWNTFLMRNDGTDGAGGWLFSDSQAGLDGAPHAQSAWADDDSDSDLDLFLANIDPFTDTSFIRRYENIDGSFVGEDLLGIRIEYGAADWGDFDADGDMDIIVTGNIQEVDLSYNTVLRVYRNDGASFSETTLIDAPNADWLDLHAATWADYDSDGDVDLLITGNYVGPDDIEGKSEVYGNEAGEFTALGVSLPAPISSVGRGGTFTWLDIDNDGDLDYFVGGAYYVPGGNGLVDAQLHLYRNDASGVNQEPLAPTGLIAVADGDTVTLSWDDAIDDHTSAGAITWDLEVEPAGAFASAAIGRRVPEPGGLSAVATWQLRGLPEGIYTWRLRSVDSAFNESSPTEGSFTIGPTGGDSIGGTIAGLRTSGATCKNLSTRQKVSTPVSAGAWDCTAGGLSAEAGEQVLTRLVGRLSSELVSGSANGVTLESATCRNLTSGEQIAAVIDANEWSCEGLAGATRDRVEIQTRSTR